MADEVVLDVARLVRFYLPDLVGVEAVSYDARLRQLLEQADTGIDVSAEIVTVLQQSSGLQAWVAQVLQDDMHRPPELQPLTERGLDLPGEPTPVDAQRYSCPVDGNFVWYRPFVGVPVISCPDHHVLLVLD